MPGRIGGSERYARELVLALGSADPGVDVTVLVPRPAHRAYAGVAGGPVRRCDVPFGVPATGAPRAAALSVGLALGGLLGRTLPAADVVHHPLTVPVVRPRGRTIITLHDVAHHEVPETFSAAERRFRRFAYDAPVRRAAAVVTPTAYSRSSIVERLGVAAERVRVVPYGVDGARFAPEALPEDDAAALAGLDLPERYVLYPANLWPHKNHLRLVQALARAEDRDLALVLTGQVDRRLDAVRAEAARLGVGRRVRHLGHLAGDLLPPLYRRSLAVVFPSRFEGFGLPVVEAMACGVPVAASDRAALPEVAAGAALAFDPEDVDAIARAIDRIVADGALREALRAAGRARAAELTWAAAAAGHRRVYESVALASPP